MPIKESARILFYLFFPAGGIGKYTHQQLAALAHYPDLELELVCLPDFHWRANSGYPTWPCLFGISHPLPPLRKLRFLAGQFVNPRRLLQRAIERRSDLVHICNINYLSFPVWERLLDRWGGKLVCTAHDVRRRVAILNRRFEERQLRRFYRRCDALFVHSQEQKTELQEFADVTPDRIHVIPHGPTEYGPLDEATSAQLRQRLGIPADRQVALMFGFVREEKNLGGFLRALARADAPRLHLVVAGPAAAHGAAYLARCQSLVRDLGLAARVSFETRYIPDKEVPHWLGLCDWVACSHTDAFTSQSGVLNLAAFYRKPVLATPTASFRELLTQVPIGLLCEGFGEQELAVGIERMVARVTQGSGFDHEAYRREFSWARNAELTRQVYRQLLEARP